MSSEADGAPPRLDPKDVAAGTALGAAQRTGVGIFRRRKAEKAAAAGTVPTGSARPTTGNRGLTALVFAILLVAMLVLMIRAG